MLRGYWHLPYVCAWCVVQSTYKKDVKVILRASFNCLMDGRRKGWVTERCDSTGLTSSTWHIWRWQECWSSTNTCTRLSSSVNEWTYICQIFFPDYLFLKFCIKFFSPKFFMFSINLFILSSVVFRCLGLYMYLVCIHGQTREGGDLVWGQIMLPDRWLKLCPIVYM